MRANIRYSVCFSGCPAETSRRLYGSGHVPPLATLIAQLSRETGLQIGGRLYSDALSVRGSPATSYLAMFTHNLELIINTLAASK